ncbi:vesicle transport through interaction with t-SNAREs homolog 1B-like [Oscarella lobularis]|uniref:vesicle transport through interaction with t-SNAREs homolog 1B-like n=1 Tax=Oscarella lobularis TaxID=121494 RepID=UPI003313E4B7
MSSERFEDLDDDFSAIMREVKSELTLIQRSVGEQRKSSIRITEKRLESAEKTLQQMEAESQNAPAAFRIGMNSKARKCRTDLERIKKELRQASSSREELFSGGRTYGTQDPAVIQGYQRNTLIQGTGSLNRASESIARSKAVATESEQVGTETLGELYGQREQLLRATDTVAETDAEVSKAKTILISMGKRVITDKLIMMIIILLELGIIGGLVYWKFFS